MLILRRRPAKTRARLAKEELSEGFDHLVQAANHAAGGVGATVGPRVQAARARVAPAASKARTVAVTGLGTTAATLAPLAIAARKRSRQVMRRDVKPVRRDPRMRVNGLPRTVLLAAGAAVGIAGAVIMRRRQQQRWDEYDTAHPTESATSASSASAAAQAAGTTAEEAAQSAATTARKLAEKASSAIDSATAGNSGTPTVTPAPAPAPTPVPLGPSAPGMVTPVPPGESPPSSNSRG